MEQNFSFERSLFGEGDDDIRYELHDVEFSVDRLIRLPFFRPFLLDKAVKYCEMYCKNSDFRQMLLDKSPKSRIIVHRLYKQGIFNYSDIDPYIQRKDSILMCYYFRKNIPDFANFISFDKNLSKFYLSKYQNESTIDKMIEFGFTPSSVEYCLKYDDINSLRENFTTNIKYVEWNPFEWSRKPDYLEVLSVSGFFGSVRCFKHLLLQGCEINDRVRSSVYCSGSCDLIHLTYEDAFNFQECFLKATIFCRLELLIFLKQKGVEFDKKENVQVFILIYISLMLQKMAIYVLLNI